MHLFVSFMLRAVSIFVKDHVVHTSAGLQEFDAVLMNNFTNAVDVAPVDTSQYVSQALSHLRCISLNIYQVSLVATFQIMTSIFILGLGDIV